MTGTDLIVMPTTGEVVELDASTDVLADQFDRLADLEREIKYVRSTISRELVDRMDHELVRKHEAGALLIEVDAPGQVEYDGDELARVLVRLKTEGKIGAQAAQQALKSVEVLKPQKRGIDKLINSPALTDEDRAAIAACAAPVTRPRRVTVTRAA